MSGCTMPYQGFRDDPNDYTHIVNLTKELSKSVQEKDWMSTIIYGVLALMALAVVVFSYIKYFRKVTNEDTNNNGSSSELNGKTLNEDEVDEGAERADNDDDNGSAVQVNAVNLIVKESGMKIKVNAIIDVNEAVKLLSSQHNFTLIKENGILSVTLDTDVAALSAASKVTII